MNLITTMGIELTFVPSVYQVINDRADMEDCTNLACGNDILYFLSDGLRRILSRKKINVHNCHVDPGCVEVSTNPYKKLDTLRSMTKKIMREASFLGLSPCEPSYTGGGAHVHTGIIGKTEEEREAYVGRFVSYAARNPWISFAFIDTSDYINAEPWHREKALGSSAEKYSPALCEDELHHLTEMLTYAVRCLHMEENRMRQWRIKDSENEVATYTKRRMAWLKRVLKNKHGAKIAERAEVTVINNNMLVVPRNKDFLIRRTHYGEHGTMEFRCFEMRDTLDAITKQIVFANAYCDYIANATFTQTDFNDIPTFNDLKKAKYSVWKAGFNNMLRELELDPADYREYCVNIALKIRARRNTGRNN